MIHIQLPYGTIIIPLSKITLQFIPKHRESPTTNNQCIAHSQSKSKDFTEIQRFFVYGTLRDDNVQPPKHTKDWVRNCQAENGRLYKFKLFKERYEDLPFAVQTNDSKDYISGRIISWKNKNVFQRKLQIADRMGGYIDGGDTDSLYIRDVVDVMNENGDMTKAIAYYQNINFKELNSFYDEIPDGDWLHRDRSRDLSEYNPTAEMLAMLQSIIRNCKENDELIDSLPLPPEEFETESDSDDGEHKLQSFEYFRISGDDIAIMNDCKTVQKFRAGICSAYGKYIVSSNDNSIYKWSFKVKHTRNGSNDGVLVIGISAKFRLYLNESFYKYDEFENYAYNVSNGYKVSQNMFEQYVANHGMDACATVMIDMELNMEECTLGYYINGQFQGIAFDDIIKDRNISYQMAVTLKQQRDEISLLSFKIIQPMS